MMYSIIIKKRLVKAQRHQYWTFDVGRCRVGKAAPQFLGCHQAPHRTGQADFPYIRLFG